VTCRHLEPDGAGLFCRKKVESDCVPCRGDGSEDVVAIDALAAR
jgi:hypothetical protein